MALFGGPVHFLSTMQSIRYLSLPAAPRLRACPYATCCVKNRLRFLEVSGQIEAGGKGSTKSSFKSDKPFRTSDIQLNNPQVAILSLSASQIFGKFGRIFRVLDLRLDPLTATVQAGHAFENAPIGAILATNDKDGAGLLFTPCENRREAARILHGADHAGNFELRREPFLHRISPTRRGSLPAPPAGCASA